MDEEAELAEFGQLVEAGIIVYLPATPEAMKPHGWVNNAAPDDPGPAR